MSFESWVFGHNNESNANQGNTSSDYAKVSSHTQCETPMGDQTDTDGFSFNGHGNFQPGRSSFHFGDRTHEDIDMFRGTEHLEPGRASFHFGVESQHYGAPYNAELSSHTRYVTPTGDQSDTAGFSFNGHGNFQPGRSSFHFGDRTHEDIDMFRGTENLEPGRASFHFGEQSQDDGTPYVSQFHLDQSTSSFPYGGGYDPNRTSVHVGESCDVYIPAPYCVDSDYGSTSSYPTHQFQYSDKEMTDAFNYPGYLNHTLGSVQEEVDGMGEEEEKEEDEDREEEVDGMGEEEEKEEDEDREEEVDGMGEEEEKEEDEDKEEEDEDKEEDEDEDEQEVKVPTKRKDKNIVTLLAMKFANQFLQKRVRIPYHTDGLSSKEWVDSVVNSPHPDRCQNVFGMQADLFKQLEVELVSEHGFQPPKKSNGVGVRECLGYFIKMLRGWTSQDMDDRFQRSASTISNHIKKITPCLEDFAAKWVAPLREHDYWRPYLENTQKYRHMKDCIGAVDGTHIPCNPPRGKAANYWSRKGMFTFNVLAIADFNLCFTFAVSGYEGAMHDYQIFKEEISKNDNRYPHPPTGKYYLVDAGYPNAKGYLAPYKGCMYHQDDFRRRSVPVTDSNERFNKVHSSLRSCVERSFGVLKKRYPTLKHGSQYDFQDAKKYILIAMGLNNYIWWHYPSDKYFRDAEMTNENYVSEDSTSSGIRQHDMWDGPQFAQTDWEMDRFRDELRESIASDYRRRNQRGRAR